MPSACRLLDEKNFAAYFFFANFAISKCFARKVQGVVNNVFVK